MTPCALLALLVAALGAFGFQAKMGGVPGALSVSFAALTVLAAICRGPLKCSTAHARLRCGAVDYVL